MKCAAVSSALLMLLTWQRTAATLVPSFHHLRRTSSQQNEEVIALYNSTQSNSTNGTNITTFAPSSAPSSFPTSSPTISSISSSNHISDQDLSFGILVVACVAGVAIILIATLKLSIATMKLEDDYDSDESSSSSDEENTNRALPLQPLRSRNMRSSTNSSGKKDDMCGSPQLNDELEEHGFANANPPSRRGRRREGKRFNPLQQFDLDSPSQGGRGYDDDVLSLFRSTPFSSSAQPQHLRKNTL
jgi:hypothetical protein